MIRVKNHKKKKNRSKPHSKLPKENTNGVGGQRGMLGANVFWSDKVFASQMVRPTFGLFNRIREKASCGSQQKPGMISRWQSTAAKGFCFACDRQHKSWKNTESQYRQGRRPGALRYCSPLEVSAIMFHIKKKQTLVCSWCREATADGKLVCGQFWKEDFSQKLMCTYLTGRLRSCVHINYCEYGAAGSDDHHEPECRLGCDSSNPG